MITSKEIFTQQRELDALMEGSSFDSQQLEYLERLPPFKALEILRMNQRDRITSGDNYNQTDILEHLNKLK